MNDPEIDFSHRQSFPGTHGNRFDTLLHSAEKLERIPGLLFGFILAGMAFAATHAHWYFTLVLWIFFLLDWALLANLPLYRKSFGPAKPTTLILAVLRSLFFIFPVYIALPAQFAGLFLVIYAFWIEPHRIVLSRQLLSSPKLNNNQPIKILHLGDLHVERITRREEQLSELIVDTQPDLILFSGDILNLSYLTDATAWLHARQVMAGWNAPSGVFAVSGSPAVDLPEVFPTLLEGLKIHWLKDEKIGIFIRGQQIDLIGISCTHKPFIDGPKLISLGGGSSSQFTILLYHSPDLAPISSRSGIDLQLSGHTHGGQVRLPLIGALFTGSLYGKRYEQGRMAFKDMTLYITRGLGMEGSAAPRVRFLCPPEATLWEIKGSDSIS
jgi:predicted MPP superfamily phosphohydrolase